MKNSKSNGKRRTPAKDAISRAAAKAVDERISEMVGPNEELFWTLQNGVLDGRMKEAERLDDEMATGTCLNPGRALLLRLLGVWVATRHLSAAQLFELGSSEEAMQLCRESLAKGFREPAGDGQVIRFPRWPWISDPLPKEAPPEKEEDETFARDVEPET